MSGLLAFAENPWAKLDDGLRFYQRDIALQVLEDLKTYRSVLVVAATGLGKTQKFAAIIGDWPGRALVLCHRDELVDQARSRIEAVTGEYVEIEKGQFRASLNTRIVIGSVDTLRSEKRLARFPKDHFSLVIVDEAHHYTGNTYTRPLEYFSEAKVVGFTATPDRADKIALGKTFEHVSAVLDISAGIELGYLVPVLGQVVTLAEIDLSGVSSNKGDLVAAQLDEVMLKAVEGIVRETVRLEPERQGICFFPGVKSAEYAAEKFNALAPESARFICGATPPDERKQIVRAFRRGEFKYLTNCQVATEGFDAPAASLIVLGRPTKSRALYTQMIGRGTRVLPGVVDQYPDRDASAVRREAVRTSAKPNVMVLDFVGNSGRHSLVTIEDVLGGRYSDAEVKLAKKKRKDMGGDAAAALEAARAELKALAQRVQAKVKSSVRSFDPFGALGIAHDGIVDTTAGRRLANKAQRQQLLGLGFPEEGLSGLGHAEADKAIASIRRRHAQGLCTLRQLRVLTAFGLSDPQMTKARASAAITYLKAHGWGRAPDYSPQELFRAATVREPGEDG